MVASMVRIKGRSRRSRVVAARYVYHLRNCTTCALARWPVTTASTYAAHLERPPLFDGVLILIVDRADASLDMRQHPLDDVRLDTEPAVHRGRDRPPQDRAASRSAVRRRWLGRASPASATNLGNRSVRRRERARRAGVCAEWRGRSRPTGTDLRPAVLHAHRWQLKRRSVEVNLAPLQSCRSHRGDSRCRSTGE